MQLPSLGCDAHGRLLRMLRMELHARLAQGDSHVTIMDVARLALLTPVKGPDQRADLKCCASWIAKAAAADNAEPGSCRLGLPKWAAKALRAYGGAARSPPLLPSDAARALASQALKFTTKEKTPFGLSIVRQTMHAMAALAAQHACHRQRRGEVQPSGPLFGGMEDEIARFCAAGIPSARAGTAWARKGSAAVIGAMRKLGVPVSAALAAQAAANAAPCAERAGSDDAKGPVRSDSRPPKCSPSVGEEGPVLAQGC